MFPPTASATCPGDGVTREPTPTTPMLYLGTDTGLESISTAPIVTTRPSVSAAPLMALKSPPTKTLTASSWKVIGPFPGSGYGPVGQRGPAQAPNPGGQAVATALAGEPSANPTTRHMAAPTTASQPPSRRVRRVNKLYRALCRIGSAETQRVLNFVGSVRLPIRRGCRAPQLVRIRLQQRSVRTMLSRSPLDHAFGMTLPKCTAKSRAP